MDRGDRLRKGERGGGRAPGWIPWLILVAGLAWHPALAAGQEPAPAGGGGALRVFLDCNTFPCDFTYFRTEIDWVNWVRDRADAQVHVIVTGIQTGSGGREYRVDFVGLGELAARDDRLTHTSLGTDTQEEILLGISRALGVGLARYANLAGLGGRLQVRQAEGTPGTDRLVTASEVDDPWDFWVFELEADANFSGESSRKTRFFGGSLEVSRTTTDWRIEFDVGGSYFRSDIELSDSTVIDTFENWRVEALVVNSLADHWSAGIGAETAGATFTNQDFTLSVGPALEYSFWPYEEAPRRRLTAIYQAGVQHFRYEEETIFGRTEETRLTESLEIALFQRQTWGTSRVSVQGSHFFHDFSKNRLRTNGFLSFRIFRGLSLNVNGRMEWIRDQLFLAAEGATDEEILLQRRRLASDFDYRVGFGFSYQFGSIYNNVVNNRF